MMTDVDTFDRAFSDLPSQYKTLRMVHKPQCIMLDKAPVRGKVKKLTKGFFSTSSQMQPALIDGTSGSAHIH